MILDGVGTCEMYDADGGVIGLATKARPRHPTPGDFLPGHPFKRLKPVAERVSEMPLPGGKNRWDLHGDGWDDSVAHALWTMD